MPHTTQPSPAEATIQPATFSDDNDIVAVFKAAAPVGHTIPYARAVSPLSFMVAEARGQDYVTDTKGIAYDL